MAARLAVTSSVVALCGVVLLCGGCGCARDVPAAGRGADGDDAVREAGPDTEQAKTQMVLSLLAALDEAEGESEEVKDELRRVLLEADKELAEVLGNESRQSILQGNQRPGIPAAGGASDRADVPRQTRPPKGGRPQRSPGPSEPGKPKTAMVRALLQLLDEAKADNQEVKGQLERSLLDADAELGKFLGGNSKRRILQANKKPPALVIGPGEIRAADSAKKKAKKKPATEKP